MTTAKAKEKKKKTSGALPDTQIPSNGKKKQKQLPTQKVTVLSKGYWVDWFKKYHPSRQRLER